MPDHDPDHAQIVLDHQDMVFRTLARLLSSRQDLDDLAQEVFLRFFRALPRFRGDAQLSTYLYRIVVNVAHDARKRRSWVARTEVPFSGWPEDTTLSWEDRLAHPDPGAEKRLQQHEFGEAVERAMARLSPVERAALVLYHQEEQSYEAIAQELLLPVNTVRTHLHRGRKRLRALLAAAGEGQ